MKETYSECWYEDGFYWIKNPDDGIEYIVQVIDDVFYFIGSDEPEVIEDADWFDPKMMVGPLRSPWCMYYDVNELN